MSLTTLAMILLQDAPADSGSGSTVRMISGVLAVVLVIIIIMRRKGGKGKKTEEDEF